MNLPWYFAVPGALMAAVPAGLLLLGARINRSDRRGALHLEDTLPAMYAEIDQWKARERAGAGVSR